ncbi:hypothetical protein SLS60_006766 [Paraconiothyrium brasiliense]|uniref:Uncharacterized protein n=1 Tax=Paraconiothyrium brasiliense TaxID=300254 RepID=A0ABR3R7H5_9PLEO
MMRSVSDNDDNDAMFENDKRDGHSLGLGAAHDKREGGPQGSVNPSAIDKRYPRDQNVGSSGSKRSDAIVQRGAPLGYGGSVYDKRDVTSEHDLSTDDQRGGASDDEHASGFDEEVFDKRQSSKGYGESVYDKRGSSKGYAGSVYDKRQSSKGYVGSVHDKRQSSKGYAGSIYDKRQSSKGYAGSIYDKRQSSKGYAGSVYDKRESEE